MEIASDHEQIKFFSRFHNALDNCVRTKHKYMHYMLRGISYLDKIADNTGTLISCILKKFRINYSPTLRYLLWETPELKYNQSEFDDLRK